MPYYRRSGDVPPQAPHACTAIGRRRRAPRSWWARRASRDSSLLYHRHSPQRHRRRRGRRRERPSGARPAERPSVPLHLRTDVSSPAGPATPVLGAPGAARQRRRRGLRGRGRATTSPLYRNAVGDELVYVQSARRCWSRVRRARRRRRATTCVVPSGVDPPLARRPATRRCELAGPRIVAATSRRPPSTCRRAGQFARGRAVLRARPPRPRRSRCSSTATDVDGARAHRGRPQPGTSTATIRSTSSAGTAACTRGRCQHPRLRADRRAPPPAAAGAPDVRRRRASSSARSCRRLFDFDPDAVKVPYHHANVDSDEVLFYSAGDFMSRAGSGIGVGSISAAPGRLRPRPAARQRRAQRSTQTATEEVAVMLDTFRPLRVAGDLGPILDPDYLTSWIE